MLASLDTTPNEIKGVQQRVIDALGGDHVGCQALPNSVTNSRLAGPTSRTGMPGTQAERAPTTGRPGRAGCAGAAGLRRGVHAGATSARGPGPCGRSPRAGLLGHRGARRPVDVEVPGGREHRAAGLGGREQRCCQRRPVGGPAAVPRVGAVVERDRAWACAAAGEDADLLAGLGEQARDGGPTGPAPTTCSRLREHLSSCTLSGSRRRSTAGRRPRPRRRRSDDAGRARPVPSSLFRPAMPQAA
jgi:hypothetical protein